MATANKTIEQQIAQHLITCAMERRTTNYLELAEVFELPTEWPQLGQVMSPILYRIFDWCETNRLPRLTVLVVRRSGADKGIPGQGFWKACKQEGLSREIRVSFTELFTAETYEFFSMEAEQEIENAHAL